MLCDPTMESDPLFINQIACDAEATAAAEGEAAATAAYLSKMEMLRELGFLNESSPEADALARSDSQLTTVQAGADAAADGSVGLQAAGTAGADSSRELPLIAEAHSGISSPQQGVVRGPTGQKTDEER